MAARRPGKCRNVQEVHAGGKRGCVSAWSALLTREVMVRFRDCMVGDRADQSSLAVLVLVLIPKPPNQILQLLRVLQQLPRVLNDVAHVPLDGRAQVELRRRQ